jgi:hypothetical protein
LELEKVLRTFKNSILKNLLKHCFKKEGLLSKST